MVLATKVHVTMGDDPNQRGNSRRWIIQEVDAQWTAWASWSGAPLPDTLRAQFLGQAAADEVRLEAIEDLVALAHPAVTSTILGPRTMDQFDDVLDRIDAIVPPGSDAGRPDPSQYLPPAIVDPTLRRRTVR